MKTGHVAVNGNEVRFRFTGKSGKQWSLRVRDRPIAKIIRTCQDLPGQELLQYLDDEGQPRDVTSSDVDPYLKEITGKNITAKDFRTWAGTVLAAMALNELKSFDSAAQAKRNLRTAIENCRLAPWQYRDYLPGNATYIPTSSRRISMATSSWRSSQQSRANCERTWTVSNQRRPLFWRCCVGDWRESSREMRRHVPDPRPLRSSTLPRTNS